MFLTAGYPSLTETARLVWMIEEAGADIVELGVPFSDPIADGPTIQASSKAALEKGTSLKKILHAVREIRTRSEVPIILFSAYNPFLKYGLGKIVRDARAVGADGFLAADLPPEEGDEFAALCKREDMMLVFLAAPTTSDERLKKIARKSTGFIYYISLKGVTGEQSVIPKDVSRHIAELKKITAKPVAVGFGVSKPEQVKMLSRHSDGIVVGSALIKVIREHEGKKTLTSAVKTFVRSLAAPLK